MNIVVYKILATMTLLNVHMTKNDVIYDTQVSLQKTVTLSNIRTYGQSYG